MKSSVVIRFPGSADILLSYSLSFCHKPAMPIALVPAVFISLHAKSADRFAGIVNVTIGTICGGDRCA